MKVVVNGIAQDLAATRLDAALVELGFADAVVATALNGDFVARTQRSDTPIGDGDRIEIVAPLQGG